MQKLIDDHKQEIRKYLDTIEERDRLFERSMKEAEENLKEMRLKRDEYRARWQKSESDKELFRKKTEMKYKGLVAKGCYQMMTTGFPGGTGVFFCYFCVYKKSTFKVCRFDLLTLN